MRRYFEERLVPDGVTAPRVALCYVGGVRIGTGDGERMMGASVISAPLSAKRKRAMARRIWRSCVAEMRKWTD